MAAASGVSWERRYCCCWGEDPDVCERVVCKCRYNCWLHSIQLSHESEVRYHSSIYLLFSYSLPLLISRFAAVFQRVASWLPRPPYRLLLIDFAPLPWPVEAPRSFFSHPLCRISLPSVPLAVTNRRPRPPLIGKLDNGRVVSSIRWGGEEKKRKKPSS